MIGAASLFMLAGRSLLNRRMTAALTIFAIAMSITLFLGVSQLRESARTSFEATISGTDLLVGARSGDVNLLLYAIFRIGNPTSDVDWDTYQEWAARPEIAWTIPISLGDSVHGFRVIGTNQSFFDHYQYADKRHLKLASGRPFEDLFDAVLGARAALELGYKAGDELVISHGMGNLSFSKHEDKPFHVVGILAPTGTPVDQAVYVSLSGMEAIHVGWEGGVASPMARHLSEDDVRKMNPQPDQVTAFLVGMKSRAMALRLQRDINQYRKEPLTAVIPAVALAQLWQVVGAVETTLTVIAGFVVVTGLIGMLTSILTSLNERRREMALLRALGARPCYIFSLLVLEAGLLAGAGCAVGILVVYLGLAAVAPVLEARYGLMLGAITPNFFDLFLLLGVVGLAMLLGAIPARAAYRRSLADGLSIQF